MKRKSPVDKPVIAVFLAALIMAVTACSKNTNDESAKLPTTALNTAVRVTIATAQESTLSSETAITGVLEAFRKATVAAEVGGRVQQRLVEPGDKLAAQQPMMLLDQGKVKSSYTESASRVEVAKVNVSSAQSELKRGKNLAASAFISKDDLEALEFALQRAEAELSASKAAAASARRTLTDTKVLAPFAGTAEIVHVQEGDYVQPGAAAVTVADFSRLRIKAGVTAAEATLLADADKALVSIDALGTQLLDGKIHSVGRIVDAKSGTYPLEIWLDAPENSALREGMIASITLPVDDIEPLLRVPAVAVFRRDGRMHVFKLVSDGNTEIAHLTAVRVGRNSQGSVAILAGLSEGDRVVVDGLFALRDGAPVIVRRSSSESGNKNGNDNHKASAIDEPQS